MQRFKPPRGCTCMLLSCLSTTAGIVPSAVTSHEGLQISAPEHFAAFAGAQSAEDRRAVRVPHLCRPETVYDAGKPANGTLPGYTLRLAAPA